MKIETAMTVIGVGLITSIPYAFGKRLMPYQGYASSDPPLAEGQQLQPPPGDGWRYRDIQVLGNDALKTPTSSANAEPRLIIIWERFIEDSQ